MAKYIVRVREVHISYREVVAESPEHALQAVQENNGEETLCEYSHNLPVDTWDVEDAEGNIVEDQQ